MQLLPFTWRIWPKPVTMLTWGGEQAVKTMTALQFVAFWNILTDVLDEIATSSQTLEKADLARAVAAV